MKAAMAKYRIDYNTWFSELTLHNGGELAETIEILKKNGYKLVDRDGKARAFTELTKQNLADTFLIFELTDEAKPKPEAEIKTKQIKRSTKKA
jgi:arginyl-tRNA synthetase